nr:NrfD/PsrC family molybdoenzyme membrane anchor subunit [Pyxidicoccus fallax]
MLDRLQRKRDGRNVDPALGVLSGEGSQQRVKDPEGAYPAHGQQVTHLPSRAEPQREDAPSYYGLPAVKEPVWIWSIPTYLYVGGVAGAASLLGLAADVMGGPRLAKLGRRCLWVGTAGDMISTVLLIHDLGRPERFLNMLRVFRPTSPMSIGSWVLAGSGGLNTLGVLLAHRPGWMGVVGRSAAAGAAVLGMPLAGYTAVLLCNTSVPIWQATHRALPLFFMSSATAAAGSLLSLLPHAPHEARVLRPYRLAGKVAELVTGVAVARDAARVSEVARPLKEGVSGALWKTSRVCSAAGLLLDVLPGRSRWKHVAADVLTTAGALAARFAIFHAGKASARNPQATFQGQRQGLGAAEVKGNTLAADGKPLKFPLPVLR